MRPAILLVGIWSCLVGAPRPEIRTGLGRIAATARQRDDAEVIARLRSNGVSPPVVARAPQPLFFGSAQPPLLAAASDILAPGAAADTAFAGPADRARALRVLAHPRAPRAPPPARS